MKISYIGNDTFRTAKLSGIYTIINTLTNSFYIGESMDINKRWKIHISKLRDHTHHNYKLLKDYCHYGEDAFRFKVIQPYFYNSAFFTKIRLLILEDAYIKHFESKYNLYNIEDTIQELLTSQSSDIDEIPSTHQIIAKSTLINELLHTNVVFNDNIAYLVNPPRVEEYLSSSKSSRIQRRLREIGELLPQELPNDYFTVKLIQYIGWDGTSREKLSIQMNNPPVVIDWLLTHKFTTEKIVSKVNEDKLGFIKESNDLLTY